MQLRLEKLEVSGFKSFVEPVTLSFAGGITGVVGPNGCGKSNISDAVTWVLGEQSAKSLRGTRMEDVIFNGSERRKPLGMAEVTLTLATDPSFPHSEDGRITLGRRVFRSGESQYRINGKLVRLKDVKDLLMDTGLGIRAYSVIEQGRIGMILSGKPQERRRLLEEAAGITRYKTRKRVAEVKLEEATANLLRLDDVVSEVERSLRSLKRQAGAARRYTERQAEYRQLLEEVLEGRWSHLQGGLAEVGAQLTAAHDEEARLAAELARDEAALAAGRERQDELASELASEHERQATLAARIEGRQEFLKANRGNLGELAERAASSRRQADEREQEIARHGEARAALAERRKELVRDLDRAESEVSEDERQLASSEARLGQVHASIEARRNALLAAVGEVNALRGRLHKQQIELEKSNSRRHYLEEESDSHAHEVAQSAEQLAAAQDNAGQLAERLAARRAEHERVVAEREATVRREAEASEERQRLERQLTTARQRHELLTKLGEAHARERSALEEALAAVGVDDPTFLSGRLQAVEGWERSLDFYLGALADAVLLAADGAALELAGELATRTPGATLVQPLAVLPESWPQVDDPAVGRSLGEALGLAPELAAALPPAYLVDEAADAQRLAHRHPGVAFLSREGVWAQGGLVHVEGSEARPGVLERERELAELGDRLPRLENEARQAAAELEKVVAERARRAEEVRCLDDEIAQLRQEAAIAQARAQDRAARHQRLTEEAEELAAERKEIEERITRLTAEGEKLTADLEGAERLHQELTREVDEAQTEVDAVKGEREKLRTASAGRRGELKLLTERLASHDREAERLAAEVTEGERLVRLWREEAERLDRRRQELSGQIEAAETELQGLLEGQSAAQEKVLAAQGRLDEHRAALRQLEERIASRRTAHDTARSQVEELRVHHAELKQEAGHLTAAFREQLSREPTAEPGPPPADLAEREAELARRKEALDRLGPVNVLAVDEYNEQEERHHFLLEQRADVVASVESLRKTIREINQTSSARFRETFAEVNESFGEIFQRLFRGGEAEMRLQDEDDLLETGIEIVARPPGKRLQNIMLLSGGEKALTAIALLFALFRTKPSPFCILDEVDAPLDDSNDLRFAQILKEMSGDTQFIVITHNKITMEIAGTLYGVTMQERGVSQVVAVELDEVQPLAEEEEQAATA